MKSRLISLLFSFNRTEWGRMEKFIESPYHNQHSEVKRLFYLLQTLWANQAEIPSRKEVFYALLPNEPFNDGKLRRVFTYLKRLVESFLVLEGLQETPAARDQALLHALSRRKLDRHFDSAWMQAAKKLEEQPLRELTYHYHQSQLHLSRYNTSTARNQEAAATLRQLGQEIDLHYIVGKLQQAQRALSFERVVKETIPVPGMEAVLTLIEEAKLADNTAVSVHLSAYNVLRGAEPDENFRKLRRQIRELYHRFHPDEIRSLLLIAVNYCIVQINAGRAEYIREVFDLYRDSLENQILFDQEVLSPYTYKNIVSSGLRLQELDWTESFVESYKKFLPEAHRDSFFAFNRAKIRFARQDFKGTIRQLQGFYSRDLFTELDARILQLKAHFELGDSTMLDAQLNNFRQLLGRKELLAYHKENYLLFRTYLNRLINLQPLDAEAKKNLIREVKGEERLIDQDWLLEKLIHPSA